VKEYLLINLYCTVCQHYRTTLVLAAQRLSNNSSPRFTDEECLAAYLFGIREEKFNVKAIYNFLRDYWKSWFPNMPAYQNFIRRINYLAPAFQRLSILLMREKVIDETILSHLLDSLPIIVASEKRSGSAKAASGLCQKGYCSSNGFYYYGVKLHVLGQKQYQALPNMRSMWISSAAENDLTVAKEWLEGIYNMEIFADKAYASEAWAAVLQERNVRLYTPIKLQKGQEYLDSADSLLSRAVSRARQAIESFFNWMQEKTHIQFASKVRSEDGLIAFIFARLASLAFFYS